MDLSASRTTPLIGFGLFAACFVAAAAFAQEGGAEAESADPPSFFQPITILGDGAPIPAVGTTPSGALFPLGFGGSRRFGFHWFANQTSFYGDNVRRLQSGQAPPAGAKRSDLYFVSTVGASYRERIGLQQVFLNAGLSRTRYLENADLNRLRYNVSGGIDWRLGRVCNGTLSTAFEQSEQPVETTAIGGETSTVQSESITFNGRCHIYGSFYGTYGAAARQSKFSPSTISDSLTLSANAGIEYVLPRLHTIGVRVSQSQTEFDNVAARRVGGLSERTFIRTYSLFYQRRISAKTSVTFSAGLNESFNGVAGARSVLAPVFGASIAWRPTNKVSMQLRYDKTASAAQGIAADLQEQESVSAGINYTYSRKLSFGASASFSRSTTPSFTTGLGAPVTRVTDTTSLGLDANYQFDTFLSANLGYRYTERSEKQTGARSRANLYTFRVQYQR